MLIALMEKRNTSAYETVFELLKQFLNGTSVAKSMTDYEYATINAVKKVFVGCDIVGCFFHFAKAVSNYAD